MTIKKKFKQIAASSWKTIPVLMFAVLVQIALLPKMSLAVVNPSAFEIENISEDEQFDKDFREGRDLIDKEDWSKAAEKFNQVIGKYPSNKSTDAALYWLAFCYKKQKQYKETDAALDRLLKDFPASSWADDARVMKAEISFPLGRVYVTSASTAYPTNQSGFKYNAELSKSVAKGTVVTAVPNSAQSKQLVELYTTAAARTPLDREDEIKIAAFQSLLSADPKRAIETMGDILNSNSKASEVLKQEVLRVLRSPRLLRSQGSFNSYSSFDLYSSAVKKEFTPLLRETLVKSFQNESNIKIRKEIIYALANSGDDQSTQYLTQLYASEKNQEIKKAIINSFSNSSSYLFESQNLFGAASTSSTPTRKLEFDKLLEIVRTEKDGELRRLAFTNLQRFSGWSKNVQTVDMLVGLYDAETDEEFKISIIHAFGNIKQEQASRKLLEIAKNDKSDKLKLEAIYALRTSNNPEALKFLEELIK